jgi:hypothetical protein
MPLELQNFGQIGINFKTGITVCHGLVILFWRGYLILFGTGFCSLPIGNFIYIKLLFGQKYHTMKMHNKSTNPKCNMSYTHRYKCLFAPKGIHPNSRPLIALNHFCPGYVLSPLVRSFALIPFTQSGFILGHNFVSQLGAHTHILDSHLCILYIQIPF